MPTAPLSLNFLPVARRELQVMAKRRSTHWLRTLAALAMAIISLSVLIPGTVRSALPTEIGAILFLALTALAVVIGLAAGPLFAADCLTEEKRQGTLGLLFLSTLRGHDIVAGKLVSLGLPALYCMLAAFPVLGVSFFLGGVSVGEFVRIGLALSVLLTFSLTAAVWVSAFSRSGRRALGGTVLLLTLICVTPVMLDWHSLMENPGSASLVALSPLAGYIFAFDVMRAANPLIYWSSISFTALASALWLALACIWLPRSWQERELAAKATGLAQSPERSRKQRTRRAAMLDQEPAVWLAGRQQAGRLTAWAPAMAFTLVTAWFLTSMNPASDSAGLTMLVVLAAHGLYKLWVASEASRKFVADRQSGELELLLSTPLDGRQIWRAHLIRLKRQFIGPSALLLAGDAALLTFGLRESGWLDENPEFTLPLIALSLAFIADSYTAARVGLWQSLTARSATRATVRTMMFTFFLPGGGGLLTLGSLAVLAHSPQEAMLWLVAGWFFIGCGTDIGLCGWTMARLSDSFREAALLPVATPALSSAAVQN